MITQRTMKVFLSVIAMLLTLLAYIEAAQAATWQFKDSMVTVIDFGGVPLAAPYSITGVFVEQDGHLPFWDILVGEPHLHAPLVVEFTSVPNTTNCGWSESGFCPVSATVSSSTSLAFEVQIGPGPGGYHSLGLELAAPLGSGADTIELVPGQYIPFEPGPFNPQAGSQGSLLQQGGLAPGIGLITGSITTIPEPRTITAAALGLALLVCLHMMVRRRFGKLQ